MWILTFKFLYWATLLVSLKSYGNYNEFSILYWPQSMHKEFFSHFIPYDGCFYLSISESGYHTGTRDCAFYPLWPGLLKLASITSGGHSLAAGLILANALSTLAWLLLYNFVLKRWGPKVGKWALIFLIAYPGSLFCQFLYSESLFLFLILVLWWGLERESFALAFWAALLLPITRPVGVFCIIPIFYHLMNVIPPQWLKKWTNLHTLFVPPDVLAKRETDAGIGSDRSALSDQKAAPRQAPRWQWALLLAPLLGWVCYLAFMFYTTGNPFEGFAAQRFWGVNSVSNLINIPKFVVAWFSPSTLHGYRGSLLDRSMFTMLVYCIPVLWRLDKRLIVWLYVLGILPTMSATFTSATRYLSMAVPLFIALAHFSQPLQWRPWRYTLLAAFIVIHACLVWRYVNFQWAG